MKTQNIDINKLIEHYQQSKNAIKTGKEFGLSGPTVLKIIRKNNIEVYGEHTKCDDQTIIDCYIKLGTVKKVEEELKVGDSIIVKVLDKHNIERKKINHVAIGNVYNKLTVIEFAGHKKSGYTDRKLYLCQCECGGTRVVPSNELTATKDATKDCGCGFRKRMEIAEQKRLDKAVKKELWLERMEEYRLKRVELEKNKKLTIYVPGYTKGRLTILEVDGKGRGKKIKAQCSCGTIKTISIGSLYKTNSCGCLQRENSSTHGMSTKYGKKWYDKWRSMVKRCYNVKCSRYKDYGGRGVTICDRWLEPNGVGMGNYYNDIHDILGPIPGPNYSLDRIDNDGNYEISNLRWATISEQNKNQRRRVTNK